MVLVPPPNIEKKLERPTETEGVFNPNPVTQVGESALAEPGEVAEDEDQPGQPFFAKLAGMQGAALFQPAEEVEGLDEAEGRPTVSNQAKP